MGANIPTGTIVTYTSGDWHVGWFAGTSDITNAVGARLISDGITIRKINSVSVNGIVGTFDKFLGGPADITISMDVQVTGGLGYDSEDDVAAIINHEVYE